MKVKVKVHYYIERVSHYIFKSFQTMFHFISYHWHCTKNEVFHLLKKSLMENFSARYSVDITADYKKHWKKVEY